MFGGFSGIMQMIMQKKDEMKSELKAAGSGNGTVANKGTNPVAQGANSKKPAKSPGQVTKEGEGAPAADLGLFGDVLNAVGVDTSGFEKDLGSFMEKLPLDKLGELGEANQAAMNNSAVGSLAAKSVFESYLSETLASRQRADSLTAAALQDMQKAISFK